MAAKPAVTPPVGEVEKKDQKKHRSPNYPGLTFTRSLDLAKGLYEKERKNPVLLDTAYKQLGYKKKNGAAVVALSALKKYGLLVPEGENRVRISDDAHAILVYPSDHPERRERIKALAMRPPIFREILAKFPDGLPSDENLSATLQHELDFGEEGSRLLIAALRDAVGLAGVDGSSEQTDTGVEDISEEAPHMPEPTPIQTPRGQQSLPPPPASSSRGESYAWDLGGGIKAQVQFTAKLGKKQVQLLKKYVELLELATTTEDDT